MAKRSGTDLTKADEAIKFFQSVTAQAPKDNELILVD